MISLRLSLVLVSSLGAALALPASAQDGTEGTHSCCDEADVELAPLPDDATAKEKWLRRIHDERGADPQQSFLNRRYVDALSERLAQESEHATFVERFSVRWTLSLFCVQVGDIERAIALCEECVALVDAHPDEGRAWLPDVLFRLAAAHFRLAERQNCIARHNEDSCIFPLSARAVHVETRGPKAAIAVLERLLADPTHDLQYEGRWLLNVAHMALGTWPDGVDAKFRIPRERLRGEVPLARLVDRAKAIGLARHDRAGALVVDDFTGDGRLDVLQCTFDTDRNVRLSKNAGDGTFVDVSEEAGLARQLGGIALAQGDIDDDGLLDVAVVRGGGLFSGAPFPNSLLRQDRPGHFEDVTAAAGVEVAAPSRAVAFLDADLDGDLDLFLGCESLGAADSIPQFPSKLFHNDGHGTFTDVTAASGIRNDARCLSVAVGDIEQDGDPDVFLSNFIAANTLFVNQTNVGTSTFVEDARARGVAAPDASGPATFLDHDADGDLDLFVTYHHHYRPIRTVAAWMIDGVIEDDTMRLFANDGAGKFEDVTAARGLRRAALATGLGAGDIDNDGAIDVYVATGGHDLAALFPNVLLVQRDGMFRDATFPAGVGHLQKGNGVAFGDADDDGDLDLGVQIGGWFLDDGFVDAFFENPGQGGHWIALDLVGTKDNRSAIGARVTVRVATKDGERNVFHTVGATVGNPLRAHIGLGDAQRIVAIEVDWPVAKSKQRIEGVELDRAYRIEQDVPSAVDITRAPIRLATK